MLRICSESIKCIKKAINVYRMVLNLILSYFHVVLGIKSKAKDAMKVSTTKTYPTTDISITTSHHLIYPLNFELHIQKSECFYFGILSANLSTF